MYEQGCVEGVSKRERWASSGGGQRKEEEEMGDVVGKVERLLSEAVDLDAAVVLARMEALSSQVDLHFWSERVLLHHRLALSHTLKHSCSQLSGQGRGEGRGEEERGGGLGGAAEGHKHLQPERASERARKREEVGGERERGGGV